MNVLSLFDGMSCGQIALQRLGKKVEKYYASEIDKPAITITKHNFPNTIHLGDVTKVRAIDLDKIDLLIGGSPCQGFSTAGKGLNFEDPRSKLFFEFVRLLKECREINPEVKFMLENVRMKEEHENVISKFLGVNAIVINSALVSAQNRVRLYWTNIGQQPAGLFGDMESIIPQPKDKGILLKHILQEEVDEKYYLSDKALERIKRKTYSQPQINPEKTGTLNTKNNSGQLSVDSGTTLIGVLNDNGKLVESNEKVNCLDANFHKGMDNHSQRTMVIQTKVYNGAPRTGDPKKGGTGLLTRDDGKVYCLDTNTNTIEVTKKIDIFGNVKKNQDKASTFTAGANSGGNHSDMDLIQVHVRKVIQLNESKESNGVQPFQQNRVYDSEGISPTLNAELSSGSNAVLIKDRIRRLTPIECCRLQTVPDDYFGSGVVSETQQYKMLGNGWTVDVVCHILSYY